MKIREISWALAIALAFCGHAAMAQQQDSSAANPIPPIQPLGGGYKNTPVPAARGVSTAYDDPQLYDPSQVTPDQNTLAGAQLFSLGSLQHSRNTFDPAISLTEQGETLNGTSGQPSWYSVTTVGGSLGFIRNWSRYRLAASYFGGENYNQGQDPPDTSFHNLSLSQEADWARWHVILRDDFTAAPGATFTGQGMGGPGLVAQYSSMLDSSLNYLSPLFAPGETIQTGYAMRYRNTALGQAQYSFSRRSALTFSGSYGLLDFSDAGYLSSHMLNAQAGYDYLLDPADSIAVFGTYGKIDYTGLPNTITDYMAALAFGRKITGRLAFQAAAGPQRIQTAGGGNGFQLWIGAVNSSLLYERRRGGITWSYARGLTSGSGVFLGAMGNTVSTSAHYMLTRFWSAGANAGYALNRSLVAPGAASTSFNTWFVGGSVGRPLGYHLHVNFNYGIQKQTVPAVCPVTSCGPLGYQQTVGMTVSWHLLRAE